jgi:3-dehydroquinate dehydratase I
MIFVSISNPDIDKCVGLIEKYKNVELRLDLINPDPDDIGILLSKAETSICTFSDISDIPKCMDYLIKSIDFGADLVDVSLNLPADEIRQLVNHAKNEDKRVMLSYHNFQSTPDREFLDGIINEADVYQPNYIKIACLANSEEDSEMLLSLMQINDRIIPVPMGETGKKGRLKAYFNGSPIVYAYPDDEKPTAPGQLPFMDYKDMDKILGLIYR